MSICVLCPEGHPVCVAAERLRGVVICPRCLSSFLAELADTTSRHARNEEPNSKRPRGKDEDDEEEEDEKPQKKKVRKKDEDEEADERPQKKKTRKQDEDEDEEDEKPRKKPKKKTMMMTRQRRPKNRSSGRGKSANSPPSTSA